MRSGTFFIVLILLLSTSFSMFSSPADEVLKNNLAISGSLSHLESFAGGGATNVENPVAYANLSIETMSPMVDNTILGSNTNYLFFSRNARYLSGGEYTKNAGSGLGYVCDEIFSTKFNSYYFNGVATFIFANSSYSIPINSGINYLKVPDNVQLENTSGNDNVTVSLDGSFYFNYSRIDTRCSQSTGSYTKIYDKIYQISFHDSKNYSVSGNDYVYVQVVPASNEQWYRNNRFDNAIASKRKFYKADLFLNGQPESSRTIKTFDVLTGDYSLQYVVTVNYSDNSTLKTGEYTINGSITPYQLEAENNSFVYIYQINSSYSGVGNNNLTLLLHDYFGNTVIINQTIKSNALTAYGALLETSSSYVRSSAVFSEDSYKPISGIGFIVLLLVLLFGFRLFKYN